MGRKKVLQEIFELHVRKEVDNQFIQIFIAIMNAIEFENMSEDK